MKSLLILAIASCCLLGQGWTAEINRGLWLHEDYHVSWSADLRTEVVVFEVTAKTLGFIGFGLSPQGGMNEADVIIGGVKDGQSYFTDRYASGKFEPTIDDSQDWHLFEATENATHTTLKFLRIFNTCDTFDLAINNDTTKFIWSMGATDDISYHGPTLRGAASVNILDPAGPVFDVSEFDLWHMNVSTPMPTADTTYWCTAHKSPSYSSMRHIVGFRVKLENEGSLAHNHHAILHLCSGTTPELIEYYESFVGQPGGECYTSRNGGMRQMMSTCETYLYVWAKGGDAMLLPENLGIPVNENGVPQYFLLEIHYDNPQELRGVQYDTGLEIYTTPHLRDIEVGVMDVGHDYSFRLMVPPATSNFTIAGHCASSCTQQKIPKEGVQIFNVLLHAHIAGRQLKLRHFRDGVELPWISYDNHYDFNYQQNRLLAEYRTVFPGDQLTFECVDDSSDRDPPEAILGGIRTQDEMCDAYIMYYPRMKNLEFCKSSFDDLAALGPLLGIEDYDRGDSGNPTIYAPEKYAGKRYSEVLTLIDWDDTLRNRVEALTRFGRHEVICQTSIPDSIRPTVAVTYPEFIPYEPVDSCAPKKH